MSEIRVPRRAMLRMLALGAVSAVVAACAPQAKPTEAPPAATAAPQATAVPTAVPPTAAAEKVELDYVYHFWPGWKETEAKLEEMFKAKFPNITIKYEAIDWGELKTTMTPRFAAKQPPDVIIADGSFPWTAEGQLIDLLPLVDRDKLDLNTISELPIGQVIGDPKKGQYGLPAYLVGTVFAYNKGLFDKYGVAYPKEGWTIEDMGKMAVSLTRDKNDKSPLDSDFDPKNIAVQGLRFWGGQMWDQFIHAFGGRLWSDDWMTCTLDDPKTIECYKFWNTLACKQHAVMGPGAPVDQAAGDPFVSQKTAMTADGDWMFSLWQSIDAFDWDVASTPQGPAGQFNYGASDTVGVPKDSKHIEEAWQFCKFMVFDLEAQLLIGTNLGPGLLEAALSEKFIQSKKGKRGPDLANARWAFKNLHEHTVADYYNQTNKTQEWQPIFNDMGSSILDLCDKEVEPLLKDTAKQITDILQKKE